MSATSSSRVGEGLTRAKIIVEEPAARRGEAIELMFNPTEYQLQKSNQYRDVKNPGLGKPPIKFVSGGVETLSVELIGDTTVTLEDVREVYVSKVRALMDPDGSSHDPPIVKFVWDRTLFIGVIEKLNITYQLFDPDGRPLRAKMSVTFKEYKSVREQVLETDRRSPDVEKAYVVRRGDTLSGIAAAAYRDPTRWRVIARANAVQDPRRLEPGSTLTVPRLDRGRDHG